MDGWMINESKECPGNKKILEKFYVGLLRFSLQKCFNRRHFRKKNFSRIEEITLK